MSSIYSFSENTFCLLHVLDIIGDDFKKTPSFDWIPRLNSNLYISSDLLTIKTFTGVGKTTLVKKVADHLRESHRKVSGFYTDEVRNGSTRVGFDIVNVANGKRIELARKTYLSYDFIVMRISGMSE